MVSKFDKVGYYIDEVYNTIFGELKFVDHGEEETDPLLLHAIYSVGEAIIEPPRDFFNSDSDYEEYLSIVDDPKQNLNFIKSLLGEMHPAVEIAKYIFREGY